MQSKRVWARVIGVDRGVVIEAVEFDEDAERSGVVSAPPGCRASLRPVWSALRPL